jgi:ankyrin repeat protein
MQTLYFRSWPLACVLALAALAPQLHAGAAAEAAPVEPAPVQAAAAQDQDKNEDAVADDASDTLAESKPPATLDTLMTAVQMGDCSTVATLLKEDKLDPNVHDSFGYTPLTMAALQESPDCIKVLLKHGAEVNIASAGGWTPFIGAAMSGASGDLLKLLLDAGADINARNQWGCTALYYAAGYGAVGTVDYLLQQGAKVPGTGEDCPTPLRIAELKGFPEVIERLKQAEEQQGNKGDEPSANAGSGSAAALVVGD